MKAKCGTPLSPHRIYIANGFGTCVVCKAKFPDYAFKKHLRKKPQ